MIFSKNAKIVIWVPEGSRGAPGDLPQSPVGLSDDLQMATVYDKKPWENTHLARLMSNWCQNHARPKNWKTDGLSLYISYVFLRWMDWQKILTPPSQTLIAHENWHQNHVKQKKWLQFISTSLYISCLYNGCLVLAPKYKNGAKNGTWPKSWLPWIRR